MRFRFFVALAVVLVGVAGFAGPVSGVTDAASAADRADTCSNAAVVGANSNLTGTLASNDDYDAWKVSLSEGDHLDMSALAPAAEQGFSVEITSDSGYTIKNVSNAEWDGRYNDDQIYDVTGGLEAQWEVWAEENAVVCLTVSDPSGDAPYEWSVNSTYRAAQYADSWTDSSADAGLVDATGNYSGYLNTPGDADVLKLSLSEGEHLDMSALAPVAQQGFSVDITSDSRLTVKNVSNAEWDGRYNDDQIYDVTGGLRAEWEVWAEEDAVVTVTVFGSGAVPYDWHLNSTLTSSRYADSWTDSPTDAGLVGATGNYSGYLNTPGDADVLKVSLSEGDHLDMSTLVPTDQQGFSVSFASDSRFTVKNVSNAEWDGRYNDDQIYDVTGGLEAQWEVWAEEDAVITITVFGSGTVPYDWHLNSTLTPSPYADEWAEGLTNARRIDANGTWAGHINTPGDTDAATVLLEQGDTLYVQAQVPPAEEAFRAHITGVNDASFTVENVSNAEWDGRYSDDQIYDVTGGIPTTWEIHVQSPGAIGFTLYDSSGTVPYNWTMRTSKNAPLTNAEPTASFGFTPTAPNASEAVTFDAAGSTDSDGTVVTYKWDFDGDGTTDATGETVNRTFASAGDRNVTLTVTDDDGARDTVNRTVSVSEPDDGSDLAGPVTVSLSPASGSVATDGTTTYDVVVGNVTGGVGSGNVNVTLANASVARITNVTVGDGFSSDLATITVGDDGSYATIQAAVGDTADTGNVTFATVTVRGETAGSTALDPTVTSLGAEDATTYEVSGVSGATVSVTDQRGVVVVGDRRSTDGGGAFAGDGLHQDINGDGSVTLADVTALFSEVLSPTVSENVSLFDFNGDEQITFADVTALFNGIAG